jgi:hypothetical protein
MQDTVVSWPVGIPVDQLNLCRFPAEVTVALLDARTEVLVCFRMAARVLELRAKPHGDLPIPPPDRSSPLPLCSALLCFLLCRRPLLFPASLPLRTPSIRSLALSPFSSYPPILPLRSRPQDLSPVIFTHRPHYYCLSAISSGTGRKSGPGYILYKIWLLLPLFYSPCHTPGL